MANGKLAALFAAGAVAAYAFAARGGGGGGNGGMTGQTPAETPTAPDSAAFASPAANTLGEPLPDDYSPQTHDMGVQDPAGTPENTDILIQPETDPRPDTSAPDRGLQSLNDLLNVNVGTASTIAEFKGQGAPTGEADLQAFRGGEWVTIASSRADTSSWGEGTLSRFDFDVPSLPSGNYDVRILTDEGPVSVAEDLTVPSRGETFGV